MEVFYLDTLSEMSAVWFMISSLGPSKLVAGGGAVLGGCEGILLPYLFMFHFLCLFFMIEFTNFMDWRPVLGGVNQYCF